MAIEMFKRYSKPILTVEIGGGLLLWNEQLDKGVQGIRNILTHYSLLKDKLVLPEKQFITTDDNRLSQKAAMSGLLEKKVTLGDMVHAGQEIGVITDPAKRTSRPHIADSCGYIFSISTIDKISTGQPIASILQTDTCSIHGTEPTATRL